MRLYSFFLILNIQLDHINASPRSSLALAPRAKYSKNGYECGNFFFRDSTIDAIVSRARNFIDMRNRFPMKLKGEIFREPNSKEYFFWPIDNKGFEVLPNSKVKSFTFGVVFFRDSNEPARVVAKTTTDDFAKCVRWTNDAIEPSHLTGEIPNSYLCGRKFFDYDTINDYILRAKESGKDGPHLKLLLFDKVNKSTAQAKEAGKNKKYPLPYKGSIYPDDSGYVIWPILAGNTFYTIGATNIRPYFLILNRARQIVDVVVNGYKDNLIRCIHSVMPQKAAVSDQFRYICGNVFFYNEDIERLAEIVQIQILFITNGIFPIAYMGPPYNLPCLIWPITKDDTIYKKGNPGNFRLILTPYYKVMDVAISSNDILQPCYRSLIKAEKNHDTSDYECFDKIFSHQKLLTAAERACPLLGIPSDYMYPARYIGPDFTIAGPYFTYPVYQTGVFRKVVGKHRVVITADCEVVGAITLFARNIRGPNQPDSKKFRKCHRKEDGALPDDFYVDNANIASEY